jgi:hypothetical protein
MDQNVRRCFELIKLRGTLSPVLLGFESGTVTAEELLPEVAALTRETELAGEEWIPSAERDRSKAALREEWAQPALARLRERAQWVYEMFRGTG